MGERADVVVIGGGPAGAAAAITAARAGLDTVIVDKAAFPRDKCCGDGITAGALRRLEELGLRCDAVESWHQVGGVAVSSPNLRTARFPLPEGPGVYAAVARRVDLDAAVLDVARDAGVKIHEGHAITSIGPRQGDEAVVVVEAERLAPIATRYVIAADGMWSPTRKLLGLREPGYLGEWHAFRQYFTDVDPDFADTLWVWFERDLLPGYAWAFPLANGTANVGFGILRRDGVPTKTMRALWNDLLSRPHIAEVIGSSATPESPHKAWPIPARVERTALTALAGRVAFVGDAARAPDPMTGEGIGQALETGMLAAESIVAAGWRRPDVARRRYERTVRRSLAVDNRVAGWLSQVLASPAGANGAARLAALTPWTRRNFARWLFEDYPRAVAATPHRWHRGVFRGPGAYRDS